MQNRRYYNLTEEEQEVNDILNNDGLGAEMGGGVDLGTGAGGSVTGGVNTDPPKDPKKESNINWWGTVDKVLDLGLNIWGKPKPKPNTPSSPNNNPPSKILGMPKPVFYGGLGIVALITTVIVVKKIKK